MKKTITITDPMQVEIGDKAYFKNYDFGFTVHDVDEHDVVCTIKVETPVSTISIWADSELFDHATREVEEPEWPDPQGAKLRVYLGTDGKRYIYNPDDPDDTTPWVAEGRYAYRSRESMEADYRDALPLVELKLVPAKDDDNE